MTRGLLDNDKVSYVVARPFTSKGKDYKVGEDFPQEEARNIEVFVRARYVIPVVDTLDDKPRFWHREVRPKDEVLERLARTRVQIVMPEQQGAELPEQEPEPRDPVEVIQEATKGAPPPEISSAPDFDPADHTVAEVNQYLTEHPEDRERVLASERSGRDRKGLSEE